MSLILDALKKLEQEKSSRRVKPRELGPAILQERKSNTSFRWRAALMIGIAVICTAAVTVLLMREVMPREQTAPVAAAPRTEYAAPNNDVQAVKAAARPSAVVSPSPGRPVAAAEPKITAVPTPPPLSALTERETAPSSIPDLKVNGIAWQEEQSARRAVVNGALVREGGFVAGARVTEILPDRVRFSVGGRLFDITNATPFQ